MGNLNNIKHLKRNFGLVTANAVLLVWLFFYIPVSSLVMLATLPSIIYSFYTKRGSLIAVSTLIYVAVLGLFVASILYPVETTEFFQNANILIHLIRAIYPYEINVSILNLMSFELIFYLTLFILSTLLISMFMKISEFSAMISFSYLICLFSAVYLIFNVFSYIIPPLQYYLANNEVMGFVFGFFYVILPFLTLNFIVLYLELVVIDAFKRNDYEHEAKNMKINKKHKLSKIFIGIGICTVILFIFIMIGGIL